jgi:putative phosphoesterase
MKIGVIADTHGVLPDTVFDIFRDVKHIFHAGDIGNVEVITGLEIICPVSAVYGNVDSWPITVNYPPMLVTELDGKSICLIHDIIKPKYFSYQMFKKGIEAEIVISGHTHVAGFQIYHNVFYLNPGSVSKPRDRKAGTVAILDLNSKPFKPKIIEIRSK